MHIALIIFVMLIAGLLVAAKAIAKSTGQNNLRQNGQRIYEAIPALLTPAERSFFGVLQQAVASDYKIFAKVRLADIIRPVRNPSRSGWQSAFNRIAGKHVDFLLCDFERLAVVGVVELDDRSHDKFERGIRDSLVDAALADAEIPVLRVAARQNYSPTQIREQVQNIFVSRGQAGNSKLKN